VIRPAGKALRKDRESAGKREGELENSQNLTIFGLQSENVRLGIELFAQRGFWPRTIFENSEALERAERFNYGHGPCGLSFVLNGSASNAAADARTPPRRGQTCQ
jgi:hypothetical protein